MEIPPTRRPFFVAMVLRLMRTETFILFLLLSFSLVRLYQVVLVSVNPRFFRGVASMSRTLRERGTDVNLLFPQPKCGITRTRLPMLACPISGDWGEKALYERVKYRAEKPTSEW